jgi:hypothetical protein
MAEIKNGIADNNGASPVVAAIDEGKNNCNCNGASTTASATPRENSLHDDEFFDCNDNDDFGEEDYDNANEMVNSHDNNANNGAYTKQSNNDNDLGKKLTLKTMPENNLHDALPLLTISPPSTAALSPPSLRSPSSNVSDSSLEYDLKSPMSSVSISNSNHEAQVMAQNLALEHRIFLRAALDMLTERDQLRMFADVNDTNNIIKAGTLRKASHRIKGMWKTKHVEIRQGVFSYFKSRSTTNSSNNNELQNNNAAINDSERSSISSSSIRRSQGSSSRKDVLLRASSCTCRAVKIRSVKITNFGGNGAVFEIKIQGGSRRLWLASSKEERQSWMQAIHSAMIGASVTRSDNFLQYHLLDNTNNGKRKGKNSSMHLMSSSPYQTFLEQYIDVGEACSRAKTKAEYLSALSQLRGRTITIPVQWIKAKLDDTSASSAFVENDITSSVEQLWKDLVRDSVEINGEVLSGESFHGPDRIVGKLTQQIILSDRSRHNIDSKHRITESQSVLYARNILLGADRTRTGGDSYYCAENLCTNRNLVVICPSSTEANPLSISVNASDGGSDHRIDTHDGPLNELKGIVSTRSCVDEQWKKSYLVLSESRLHLYDERDNAKLINQVDLFGTKIDTVRSDESHAQGHVISVASGDGSLIQEFLFEDEFDFFLWKSSFEKAAVKDSGTNSMQSPATTLHDGNAKQSAIPTVDVSVNVSTEYKICTLDPQGEESEDTWGTIRTTFKQQFRLSGTQIFCGDEVVHLELL